MSESIRPTYKGLHKLLSWLENDSAGCNIQEVVNYIKTCNLSECYTSMIKQEMETHLIDSMGDDKYVITNLTSMIKGIVS